MSAFGGDADMTFCAAHVCFWLLADMAALHISAFGNKADMTQFWAVGNILGWLFWIQSQSRSTVKCLYEGFWSHAHLCFVGTVQTPEKLPIR